MGETAGGKGRSNTERLKSWKGAVSGLAGPAPLLPGPVPVLALIRCWVPFHARERLPHVHAYSGSL